MTVIEGKRSIFVATPAQFLEEDIETAWAGAEQHIVIRDGFSWILGRYVEADNFNTNGHLFPLDDLKTSHKTIDDSPLNIGHQRQYIVGHYAASALVYPTAGETVQAAVSAGAPGGIGTHPYVEALAAMWKGLFPEEYKKAKRAQENGSLYFSMESRPKSFTCMTDGGCGLTFDYDGPSPRPSYCDELNQPRSRKRMNKNTFMGGALIIPPMRPGWRRADITEISALVQEHAEQAEQLYDDLTAVGGITAEVAEDLMLRLLAGAYGFVPEVVAPKADQARGRGAEGGGLLEVPGLEHLRGPSAADLDVASLLAVELAAHTGVIVAIVPPPEVAEALAALGDEVPEQIHVTVCFLGNAGPEETLGGRTVDEVSAALAAFAAGAPSIGEVKISGLGRFALDDGSEVTYASVDAPALPELRARLVAALEAAGVPVDHGHGSSPHVSISYTAPGAGPTEMPPALSWTVDSVELWWGDAQHRSFRLAGGEVPFSGVAHS